MGRSDHGIEGLIRSSVVDGWNRHVSGEAMYAGFSRAFAEEVASLF